jgi:hypothetical protein
MRSQKGTSARTSGASCSRSPGRRHSGRTSHRHVIKARHPCCTLLAMRLLAMHLLLLLLLLRSTSHHPGGTALPPLPPHLCTSASCCHSSGMHALPKDHPPASRADMRTHCCCPAPLQVFDSLQQSTLTDEHLALMRPLHQRGARETKKQRLR